MILGWCMTGHHDDNVQRRHSKPCPGILEGARGLMVCDCWCHGGSDGEAPTMRQAANDDAGAVPVPS